MEVVFLWTLSLQQRFYFESLGSCAFICVIFSAVSSTEIYDNVTSFLTVSNLNDCEVKFEIVNGEICEISLVFMKWTWELRASYMIMAPSINTGNILKIVIIREDTFQISEPS